MARPNPDCRGDIPPLATPPPPGAPVWRRLAALAYDGLLLTGVLFAATLAILPWRGGQAFHPHDPWFSGYLLGVSFLFFGWFWTHGGQTPGMRCWKIRLLADDGGPVGWKQAAARFIWAWIAAACFGLGYGWMVFDVRKRAWHDLATGTLVRREAGSP